MSKEAFKYILETVNLPVGERSTRLTPKMRLALCLELLGGGGYQWVSGNDFMCPVSQGTLSKIFSEVLEKLEEVLCPIWIKFEPSSECKKYFYEKFNIPGGKILIFYICLWYYYVNSSNRSSGWHSYHDATTFTK